MTEEGLKIVSTTMWRNSYGRLFKRTSPTSPTPDSGLARAGPDALGSTATDTRSEPTPEEPGDLFFKFSPEMKGLITPSPSSLPVGSDGWAIHHGMVSVTPLRASFGEMLQEDVTDSTVEDRIWKMKL